MARSKHSIQARATLPALLTACATLLGTPTLAAAAEDPDARTSMSARNDPAPAAGRIERLFAGAEEAYRAKRWALALEGFNAIVAIEPNHAKAWLRIGNVHQQRRQWLAAASAYRKAARRDDSAIATNDAIRARALVNLASVNVELANAALAEVDRLPPGSLPDPVRSARDEVAGSASRAREATVRAGATAHVRADRASGANDRKPLDAGRQPLAIGGESADAGGEPIDAGREASAAASPSRLEIEYLRGAPKP